MAWIPTLYVAEGLPYVAVNTLSVIMYKNLGMSNTDIAFYTGWLYLPWVIKPFWSPFVDIIRTKRWWTVTTQFIIGAAFAAIALTLPLDSYVVMSLAVFWLIGFASATHDIAADGYYMLALDSSDQSLYVGIRSAFYRLATIIGQGGVVMAAGWMETAFGNVPRAWAATFLILSALFFAVAVYHSRILPRPAADRPSGNIQPSADRDGQDDYIPTTNADVKREGAAPGTRSTFTRKSSGQTCSLRDPNPTGHQADSKTKHGASRILREFIGTFGSFFRKKDVWIAVTFILLYRFPEAQLVKMINPFLLDPSSEGGLGLSTAQVGLVYGTIGIIGLTLGGILGGVLVSRYGLKRCLWPMALALTLPCGVFLLDEHGPARPRLSPQSHPDQCLRLHRAVRLRCRIHLFHAVHDVFRRRSQQDLPLRDMHRLHGPRHDDSGDVRWRPPGMDGLHRLLLVDHGLLPRHPRRHRTHQG